MSLGQGIKERNPSCRRLKIFIGGPQRSSVHHSSARREASLNLMHQAVCLNAEADSTLSTCLTGWQLSRFGSQNVPDTTWKVYTFVPTDWK